MADNIIVIELVVQLMELHQEIEHVDYVKEYLQNQRIILDAAIVFQKLNALLNDGTVWLVGLQQLVVVRLLHDQEDNLHEVEEAQILIGLLVRQQNEIHNVFYVVFVRDLLDVL